jgi:flagellar hook-associated protein 2
MAGISVPGLGSGLDIEGMSSGLARADMGGRISNATKQADKIDSKISGLSAILAGLDSFDTNLDAMGVGAMNGNKLSYMSESKIMEVNSKGYALSGNYEIEVSSVASAHMLKSGEFSSSDEFEGDLNITVNGTTSSISIPAGSSVYEVADRINNGSEGVMAVVINNGSGDVLSISSKSKGQDGLIVVDGIDSQGSNLSKLDFNSYDTTMIQTRAASNAVIKINGVTVESSTNTFNDTISGLELTINTDNALDQLNDPQYFTIEEDDEIVFKGLDSFISQYNAIIGGIKEYTSYNSEENKAAAFTGDSDINMLLRELQTAMISQGDNPGSAYQSLYSIGVKSEVAGSLSIDKAKFMAALEDDRVGVISLISNGFGSNNSGVTLSGEMEDISESFNKTVVVNSKPTASNSVATASLATDPNLTAVTISRGIDLYFGGALLLGGLGEGGDDFSFNNYSELLSQINQDLADNNVPISAKLSTNFLNGFYQTSILFEQMNISAGLLEINDISGLSSFGSIISNATTTGQVSVDGVDTDYINSFKIENDLIEVEINNDSITQGESFSIFASKGFSHSLKEIIKDFAGDDGFLKTKSENLQTSKTTIGETIDKLYEDQDKAEERYLKQFQALDILLTKLRGEQDQLSAQLDQITNFQGLNS